MIGFANLGDINSHLLKLEESMDQPQKPAAKTDMASSMLVFYVRGLFSSLHFPFAQFPCTTLSGDQIYDPFWEAVERLEFIGFKVMALICDGLAANRRFFRIHFPGGDNSLPHKVPNPFAPERSLYFIVDPPHLLKTVRNGWASNKRRLQVKKKQ